MATALRTQTKRLAAEFGGHAHFSTWGPGYVNFAPINAPYPPITVYTDGKIRIDPILCRDEAEARRILNILKERSNTPNA